MLELNLGSRLDLRAVVKFQQAGVFGVAEFCGEEYRGEALAIGVKTHHRIVVTLASEGDTILGGGQLLRQLLHILAGFEVRVGFHGDVEFTQGPLQDVFGGGELGDVRAVLRDDPFRRWNGRDIC